MGAPRQWDDHPAFLDEATHVTNFYLADVGAVQVLKMPAAETPSFYVTVGNLFHSETVECDSAEVALRVIHSATLKNKTLPPGARLVPC